MKLVVEVVLPSGHTECGGSCVGDDAAQLCDKVECWRQVAHERRQAQTHQNTAKQTGKLGGDMSYHVAGMQHIAAVLKCSMGVKVGCALMHDQSKRVVPPNGGLPQPRAHTGQHATTTGVFAVLQTTHACRGITAVNLCATEAHFLS